MNSNDIFQSVEKKLKEIGGFPSVRFFFSPPIQELGNSNLPNFFLGIFSNCWIGIFPYLAVRESAGPRISLPTDLGYLVRQGHLAWTPNME